MAGVRVTCFRNGVVVHVNDTVEVERDDLRDVMKLLEVVLVSMDEGWKSKRSKIANGGLVGCRVLDNLSAKIR